MPECQKIKNGGLDQYGPELFEQQQFGTAGVEGVKLLMTVSTLKTQATKYFYLRSQRLEFTLFLNRRGFQSINQSINHLFASDPRGSIETKSNTQHTRTQTQTQTLKGN